MMTRAQRELLLTLVDGVCVDDFSDAEWESLNMIRREVAALEVRHGS